MIRVTGLNLVRADFVLGDLDLSLARGEFFALIGPTGSGKTLTLEAVAGLTPIRSGRIHIGGREVTGLPPEQRKVGIVYQDHALFPHLSVGANISFGLRYRGLSGDRARDRIRRTAVDLGIEPLLERAVTNLSGGERQRVALARALACRPEVLLLDEPLSALDPNFREELRLLIKEIHLSQEVTVLMVSHDFNEVLFLAQRAAVIHQGRIQQTGPVEDIFQRPANPFVANFVGMKNVLPCRFQGAEARLNGLRIRLKSTPSGTLGHLGIRPEELDLHLQKPAQAVPNLIPARIKSLVDLGLVLELRLQAGEEELKCRAERELLFDPALTPGSRVWLSIHPEAVHIF